VAVHRSPGGRPVRQHATHHPTHHPAHRAPRSHGAAARTSAAATLGAVTTGAFTAILPAVETSAVAQADAPIETTLATMSVPVDDVHVTRTHAALLPVRTVAAQGALGELGDGNLAQLDKASTIAARIAELHASQQRERAEQARIDSVIAEGGLDGWIAEALDVMDLPMSLAPSIKKIILKESNGNPNAINRWDANARRGTPSQGLMQTIPSTFRRFVHPSLAGRSITDPVANITAGVRYMIATYGMDTLEQGGRRSMSGSYVGY